MKQLWIVNKRCGALQRKLSGRESTGGLWLDAMLDEVDRSVDDTVVVVNVEKRPVLKKYVEGNVVYYTIKGEPNARYKYNSREAISQWKKILLDEKPDVMIIWGTEFPYSLAPIKAMPDIPCVVYIQGILDSIGKYYLSGLTRSELFKSLTLRDIMFGTTIRKTKELFEKRSAYEQKVLKHARHIIIENKWAEAYCRKIYRNVIPHYLPISISDAFNNHQWQINCSKPHTLMCSAADYPIKGLHMLLKALAIVKEEYPDVQLFIPGTVLRITHSLKDKIKETGYNHLINKIIHELSLADNIRYLGRLTALEMAKSMANVNCFIMCSSIENHSSTLKEAMRVGVPCIASYVGGVPEYAHNEENCLLYRYEDYEVLAQNIRRLFTDHELCLRLSAAAKTHAKQSRKSDFECMKVIIRDSVLN